MKIIIAGGRDFRDYTKLESNVDSIIKELDLYDHEVHIITGGAKGADKLGEQYAIKNSFTLEKYPANWNKYGKSAGPIRNAEMAKVADVLIAFWDGKSKGTKDMIDRMINKQVYVRIYEK